MTAPIAVLVVEDDEEDYLLTRDLLDEVDTDEYDVKWVDTFEAGLQELLSGRYDLCLVDFSLGAQTGLDLLREAVARECKVPILFLTGQSDRELVVEVMRAGAVDYLVKGDFSAQQLQRSIRYALEHSRSLNALRRLHVELAEARAQVRDMEVIRRQNAELDRLTIEIEASRRTAELRALELAASNERLQERERENQQLIVRLRELVAQLSTPILRVWHDILALPIIGKLDRERADTISARALHEINAQRIRYIVFDLTGVSDVDAETVGYLETLAQAARLLGARCFVCGLSPAVVLNMTSVSATKHAFEAVRDLHETLVLIASLRAGA